MGTDDSSVERDGGPGHCSCHTQTCSAPPKAFDGVVAAGVGWCCSLPCFGTVVLCWAMFVWAWACWLGDHVAQLGFLFPPMGPWSLCCSVVGSTRLAVSHYNFLFIHSTAGTVVNSRPRRCGHLKHSSPTRTRKIGTHKASRGIPISCRMAVRRDWSCPPPPPSAVAASEPDCTLLMLFIVLNTQHSRRVPPSYLGSLQRAWVVVVEVVGLVACLNPCSGYCAFPGFRMPVLRRISHFCSACFGACCRAGRNAGLVVARPT